MLAEPREVRQPGRHVLETQVLQLDAGGREALDTFLEELKGQVGLVPRQRNDTIKYYALGSKVSNKCSEESLALNELFVRTDRWTDKVICRRSLCAIK